jgi:Ca2+-transporting ATPase
VGADALPPAWQALTVETVIERLRTSPNGLPRVEADARRRHDGPNLLTTAPPTPAWHILLEQFRSVVVALLATAALVAWVTHDALDALVIGGVLLLNAALGFTTELRARRAIDALSALTPRRATVRRPTGAGAVDVEEDAADLVAGDVIVVEAGGAVPADARLISEAGLRVDEAALTGESMPVSKSAGSLAADLPLADRRNLLYAGTTVADGRGIAVVVATGMRTELGRIGVMMAAATDRRTPLELRLDALGHRLVWIALAVAAVVAALGLWHGHPASVVIGTALALAVAAVPEGLPAVATIALAVGVHRMARRRALVRRLPSVESLGSVTVVATDKTGTLTAGQMTVRDVWTGPGVHTIEGEGYAPAGTITPSPTPTLHHLIRAGVLAGRGDAIEADGGWVAHGDPTDVALLVLGRRAGLHRSALAHALPEIGELPFSSHLRLMATYHRTDAGRCLVLVKGAPTAMLDRCTRWMNTDGQEASLDADARALCLDANARMASEGLRVIGLAETTADTPPASAEDVADLTFLGLAGLMDPPAPGVRDTIADFRAAGIRTVMITGDQALTARAVGRDLGLLDDTDEVVTGQMIDARSDDELGRAVSRAGAYSRVSPEAKLRVVAALQAQGHIVAMLGDGVNDAAALKRADVGVAMGRRGTDVARDASDVVLQDDWFPTIGAAIEEGRVIYDNIRKFVFYLFSCNLAEIGVLLAAALAGLVAPLSPIQILWLNLVTDTFPALALAVEPAEPGVMRRPPRPPEQALLSAAFLRAIAFHAGVIAAVTLGAWAWAHGRSDVDGPTVTFVTLALAQLFHLGTARSHAPVVAVRRITANPWALAAVALVLALQWMAVEWSGLATLLGTVPLPFDAWLVALGLAAVPAVIGQVLHALRRR